VRFHVNLPNCMHVSAITQPWELEMDGADIIRVAQLADDLGFYGTLLPEHFVTPNDHLDLSGNHYFHATTAQGVIAGATKHIKVGSLINILPLHHPVVTAKALATLDWLSGGRAFAGFGVGWLAREYEILGVPFDQRGRLADEYLAAIHVLLHDEKPSFEGEFVSFSDVSFGPMPISKPHPPIWMGGDADAVILRAARFADGWAPWLTPLESIPEKLDLLRSSPGWTDRPFSVFYSMAVLGIGEAHAITADPRAISSTDPQQVIEQIGRLTEVGVTDTWVNPPPVDSLEAYLDHLRWVAERVVPACT
jgi:probable F420-dependent oxidoreductase